jgi:hypothetical protein
MSTQPERPSTSDVPNEATYKVARGVSAGLKISTSQPILHGRTVVTSAKEGSVELRYAPRNSRIADARTDS